MMTDKNFLRYYKQKIGIERNFISPVYGDQKGNDPGLAEKKLLNDTETRRIQAIV